MSDLYAILGVSRDADIPTIRKAYRRAAKSAHPDHGGDADKFMMLQRAHDVLTDPGRRARYDQTGVVEEVPADNGQAEVVTVINRMLTALISGDGNLVHTDLVAEMTTAIAREGKEMRDKLASLSKTAERAKKIRDRFHRKAKGDNAIRAMIDWQLQQIELANKQLTHLIGVYQKAQMLLQDYRFERDAAPKQFFSANRQTYTSATTW